MNIWPRGIGKTHKKKTFVGRESPFVAEAEAVEAIVLAKDKNGTGVYRGCGDGVCCPIKANGGRDRLAVFGSRMPIDGHRRPVSINDCRACDGGAVVPKSCLYVCCFRI